jgi:hypothetical protein
MDNPSNVGAASRALLCDFDNACTCEPHLPVGLADPVVAGATEDKNSDTVQQVPRELKTRTVRFVACSPVSGFPTLSAILGHPIIHCAFGSLGLSSPVRL